MVVSITSLLLVTTFYFRFIKFNDGKDSNWFILMICWDDFICPASQIGSALFVYYDFTMNEALAVRDNITPFVLASFVIIQLIAYASHVCLLVLAMASMAMDTLDQLTDFLFYFDFLHS